MLWFIKYDCYVCPDKNPFFLLHLGVGFTSDFFSVEDLTWTLLEQKTYWFLSKLFRLVCYEMQDEISWEERVAMLRLLR